MKQNIITTKMFENAKEYWFNKLSGQLVELNLSADFPKTKEYQEANYKETFENELAEMLIRISKNVDLSLYTLLLTFFKILLHKLIDQNDIAIATSTLENSSQNFNKCIILRDILWPEMTFKELLMNIKHTVAQGYKNQYYPVRKLMKLLKISKDFSLFKIIFLLENIHKKQFVKDLAHDYGNDIIFSVTKKDNRITSNIVYNTKLFKKETIEKLFDCYCFILTQVMNDTSLKISHIKILSEEEKKKIIFNFNNTTTVYPRDKTVNELFAEQVKKTPGKFAIVSNEKKLTYKEYDEKSIQLARSLKMKGVKPGDIVSIMLERSPELMVALLAILKAGAAYLPIDPNYPENRKQYMLKDSGAKILLIIQETASISPSTFLPFYPSNPSNLAYIIYTSGSTGTPKGVMVTQRNIVRLVKQAGYMDLNENDRLLMTGLPVFDISTFEIWAPLLNGLTLYLADDDTIFDADKLGKTLAENKISILHLIPQLFNQLAARDMEIFNGLRYLMVGGDMVRPTYINNLRNKYKKINILHMYGPTENTTFSTSFLVDKEYDRGIPLGKPIGNSKVFILNKINQLQPPGVAGELCTGGDGVARGYLNNPELTHEKFICNPYNPDERLYKTGDLARWLPDGNIAFLGRCDQQLKVRGNRIEPGEIENQLLNYNHVTEAVVISKENEEGEKYLIAYIAADEELNIPEFQEYLVHQLPTYMIPSYLVQLDHFPLNHNGKIDHKALPEPQQEKNREHIAPENPIEKKLVELWQQVLDRDYIGVMDDFFTLGGNSLKATILVSKIHKEFNVKIPLAEIFKKPVIKELSRYIRGTETYRYSAINPGERKEYYALSSAQNRLYFLWHMDLNSTAYNIPMVLTLAIEIEKEKLGVTFQKLISRHDSLRTSFIMIQEEPVQRVHQEVKFALEYYEAQGEEAPDIIENFIRPFDLSETPLLRVGLISTGEGKPLLLVDIHHIIADGISDDILSREFYSLYSGEELSPIRLQYKDYSEWQKSKEHKQSIRFQETYWINKFSDELPILDLPTDYPRPLLQNFAGKKESFILNNPGAGALKDMAKKSGVTFYMYILAVFNVFLAKLTGKEDIIIGTPIAARWHPDLEKIVGMFVNTLAIRNYPLGHQTFNLFLKNVKAETLEAYENQEYQFEDLVNKLDVKRETGRNPLFDVFFTLVNINGEPQLTPRKEIKETQESKSGLYTYEHKISKFDLSLKFLDRGNHLAAAFEYPVALFKKETIQRFVKYFRELVLSITTHPAKRIADLEIIPLQEKKQILVEFNDTKAEYPQNKTLDELFAGQVEKTPDNIAVIDQAQSVCPTARQTSQSYLALTYRELHKKAQQLAYYLMEKGVRPGTIAPIMAKRSVEMIIGILGILKSGGAYLPIDLDYPEDRIAFMMADSNAKILVTSPGLSEKFEKLSIVNCQLLMVNEKSTACRRLNNPPKETNSINNYQLKGNNPAYIIYTSGSTGRPKGVLIEHSNVVRLMVNDKFQFDFNCKDVWTMFHSFCFDFSVWEMYGALLYGGKLVVIPKMEARDTERYLEILKEQGVTVLNQTPSAFYQLMNLEITKPGKALKSRYIIFGGEVLSPGKLKEWGAKYPGTKLINMYGITETTVHVTFKEIGNCEIEADSHNIGKPIPTLSIYVMDKQLNLLPVGIAGELCVSGAGVGRGYLNQPELTQEKFKIIDDQAHNLTLNTGHLKLYRTGDFGRWLLAGEIEYLGRIDRQVKIRGYRIELGEIESRLAVYAGINQAVVTAREEKKGDRYLCVYIVAENDGDISIPQLREYLLNYLPGYMVPSYFAILKTIPLTPNGKIDRKVLPAPEIEAGEEYIAPRNEMETKIAGIWSEVLGIDKKVISIDSNFFQSGGHSLKVAIMASKIHKEIKVELPLAEIFKNPTIRALSRYITAAKKSSYTAIASVEKREYYQLSSAQKRLYILRQLDFNSTSYNITGTFYLSMKIEKEKVEEIFKLLINRHDSLRTSFVIIDKEPVQQIHEEKNPKFRITNYNHLPNHNHKLEITNIITEFVRPFDLSQAPLLRVGYMKTNEKQFILFIDMHHIIADGFSLEILEKEFLALCEGKMPPPLRIKYKDYVHWQNSEEHQELMKKQEKYWLKNFSGPLPVLKLSTDYPRPPVQTFAAQQVDLLLTEEEAQVIRNIAEEARATVSMSILALLIVLFSKLSGQEDIVIGIPIEGRKHTDLLQVVGMFVNMLAIRNYPCGDKSFKEFMLEVKERTLEAFDNQDYQFEDLVEHVAAERQGNRNPIFDIAFNVKNIEKAAPPSHLEKTPPGTNIGEHVAPITVFDIILTTLDYQGSFLFCFKYNATLFKLETINRHINYFKAIISSLKEDTGIKLKDLYISPGPGLLMAETSMVDQGDFVF